MLKVLPLLAVLTCTVASPDEGPLAREDVDRLHASMVVTFKRDRPGVERFYTADAVVVEPTRRHVGRAAVQKFWEKPGWTSEWTQETFALGGEAAAPWVAGRSVMTRLDATVVETFFVRLLTRDPNGDWRILAEALSSDRGTGAAPEVEAAMDRWLAVHQGGAAVGERQTRLFGALAVSTGRGITSGDVAEAWTTVWIQNREGWQLAAHRRVVRSP